MALRHSPLDDSHQPFKRLRRIGPGPRGRETLGEKKNWECNKVAGAKYVQMCIWVGPEGEGHRRGAKKVVKTKRAWKKKYNKDYNKHLKKLGRPKARTNTKQPNYRYRQPRTVIAIAYTPAGAKLRKALKKKASSRRRAA